MLGEQFEEHRTHLRAVAYRMLGSLGEADDAVQEAWLRLQPDRRRRDREPRRLVDDGRRRASASTCCASRRLTARGAAGGARARPHHRPPRRRRPRARGAARRRRRPGAAGRARDAAAAGAAGVRAPRHVRRAVRGDRDDRSADRRQPPASSPAGRGAACRARRRSPDADLARQREVVDAFFAAARGGDFDALVAVLDPDVVLRSDAGAPGRGLTRMRPRGGRGRRRRALTFARRRRRCARRWSTAPPVSSSSAHVAAGRGDGVHRDRRQDRGDRRPRRPGATAQLDLSAI